MLFTKLHNLGRQEGKTIQLMVRWMSVFAVMLSVLCLSHASFATTTTLESDIIADSLIVDAGDTLVTDGFNIDVSGTMDINGTLDATSSF